MYDKGKKLDSKGIILACVGIIAVCIAINIAFAAFPPMGRSDGTSSEESSIGTDVASEVSGDESDDGQETDVADGQGETAQVDPSIVSVPDNLPEEATQAGFQDAVAAYLTSLTSEYGVPEKTLIESSDVNAGMGPDGSDIPYWVIRAYFPNETEIPVTVDFTKGEGFNVGTY